MILKSNWKKKKENIDNYIYIYFVVCHFQQRHTFSSTLSSENNYLWAEEASLEELHCTAA